MNEVRVKVGLDPSKVFSQVASGYTEGINRLTEVTGEVQEFIRTQVDYIKEEVKPEKIIGGADTVIQKIKEGDFNFFVDWATSTDTPLIARAAGLAALAAAGIGTIAVGKSIAAAGSMKILPATFSKFLTVSGLAYVWNPAELVRGTRHLVTEIVNYDFTKSKKEFIEESKKQISDVMKSVAGNLGGLGGSALARFVTNQVDTGERAVLEVNRRMLGILYLTQSEEVFDEIAGSLAGIVSQLTDLGKDLLSKAAFYFSKDFLEKQGIIPNTSNHEGDNTLSALFQGQTKELMKSYDMPDWMQEALGQGGSEFIETLWSGLENKADILSSQSTLRMV